MLLLWESLVREASNLLWGFIAEPEPESLGVSEMLFWGIVVCAVSCFLWCIMPQEPQTKFMRAIKSVLMIIGLPVLLPLSLMLLTWESIQRAFQNHQLKKKLKKQEKGMKTVNEMKFAILGPSGAGKTTLLACMAEEFERISSGTIFPADESTFMTLNKAYKSLVRDANNSATRQFERSIEGTSMMREFLFHIVGHRAVLPVRFYDFSGGWIIPGC